MHELPWRLPETVCAALSVEPDLAWLDSAVQDGDPRSRYSTIAVRPFRIVGAVGGTVTIDGKSVRLDPFQALRAACAPFRLPPDCGPTPFPGGAIGLLGYELGGWLEHVPCSHQALPFLPDLRFGLFDVVLAFDHAAKRCWILSSGFPERDREARRKRALARAEELELLLMGTSSVAVPRLPQLDWTADLPPTAYRGAIDQVLDAIRAGDIFQANLTMRVSAPRPADCPTDPAIHLRLRRQAPGPFSAFLRLGQAAIASVSPERFLRLAPDGRIEARPIKGTRRRDPDRDADAALRRELEVSAKDQAENLMIVDLLRNDLARVAEIGSVAVPVLAEVESFSAVHHLVSVVEGRLRPALDAVDLLRATFPGGSVTGAPKIQAMRVIDAVEASRRGPYCGAVAALGFDGALDSSIVIRTLVLTPETITAQAGGGIVADSDPAAEHAELWLKLEALLKIFGEIDA